MTSPHAMPILPALLVALGLPAGAVARRLLGRLRRGARVPVPWCELGVALAWGATGAAAGAGMLPVRWVPVLLGLGWLAVAAGAVDVLHHRLPDALTVPALPLALLLLAPLGPAAVLHGLVGSAVACAVHAALHLAASTAMGAGDVKLAAPVGAVLAASSWEALALGGLLAALLSAALAVGSLVRRCPGRRALPHGPSMLVATWLVAAVAAGAGARPP